MAQGVDGSGVDALRWSGGGECFPPNLDNPTATTAADPVARGGETENPCALRS